MYERGQCEREECERGAGVNMDELNAVYVKSINQNRIQKLLYHPDSIKRNDSKQYHKRKYVSAEEKFIIQNMKSKC